jgi:hypothetical protein
MYDGRALQDKDVSMVYMDKERMEALLERGDQLTAFGDMNMEKGKNRMVTI